MQQAVYLIVALAIATAVLSIAVAMKAVLPPPEAPLNYAEALVYVKVKPLNGSYWVGVYAPYGDVEVRQVRVNNAVYSLGVTAPVGRDVWLNASGKPITAQCGDSVELVTSKGSAARSLAFTVQCPVSTRRVELLEVYTAYFYDVAKYVLGFDEVKIMAWPAAPGYVVIKNVSPDPLLLTFDQFPIWVNDGGLKVYNDTYGWVETVSGLLKIKPPAAQSTSEIGTGPAATRASPPTGSRCLEVSITTSSTSASFKLVDPSAIGSSTLLVTRYALCNAKFYAVGEPPPGPLARPWHRVFVPYVYDMILGLPPAAPLIAPWHPVLLPPNGTVLVNASLGVLVVSVYPARWLLNGTRPTPFAVALSPWRAVGVYVDEYGRVQWLREDLTVAAEPTPFTGLVALYGGLRANVTTRPVAWATLGNASEAPRGYAASFGGPQPCISVTLYNATTGVQVGSRQWCPCDVDMFGRPKCTPETGPPGIYAVDVKYVNQTMCINGQCKTYPVPVLEGRRVSDAYAVYVNGTRAAVCWGGKCPVRGPAYLYFASNAPYAYTYAIVSKGPGSVGVCGNHTVELWKIDREWRSATLVVNTTVRYPCPGGVGDGGGSAGGCGYATGYVNCRDLALTSWDEDSKSAGFKMTCDRVEAYICNGVIISATKLGSEEISGTLTNWRGQMMIRDKDNPEITCPATSAIRNGTDYLTCPKNNQQSNR